MKRQVESSRGARSLIAPEHPAHPAAFSTVHPVDFRRNPMLFTALAFAVGVMLSTSWRAPATLFAMTAAAIVAAAISTCKAPRFGLPCTLFAFVTLGWTCGVLRPKTTPPPNLAPYGDNLRRTLLGYVLRAEPLVQARASDNEKHSKDPSQLSVDLRLQEIEALSPDLSIMQPASGVVRIAMDDPAAVAKCGARISLVARLRPPSDYRDPGIWHYSNYLAESEISLTGTAIPNTEALTGPPVGSLECNAAETRHWAAQQLQEIANWEASHRIPSALRISADDTAILTAMLTGSRSLLTPELRTGFERTGTFHLFVVAGMHIALIAATCLWLLERLRLPRWLVTLCTICITAAYAWMTGFGEPVQRALLMTVCYLIARLLFRTANPLNSIGFAVIAILTLRPKSLFDTSFQMTVLVILALGGIAQPILVRSVGPFRHACSRLDLLRLDRHLPPRLVQFRVSIRSTRNSLRDALGKPVAWVFTSSVHLGLLLTEMLIASLIAEAVMALPMALYFHRVTLLALPANVALVPLLLPLLVCAAMTVPLTSLSPWLALATGAPAALLLHWGRWITGSIAHLSLSNVRVATPPMMVTVLCIVSCVLAIFGSHMAGRRPVWATLAPLGFTAILLVAVWPVHKSRDAMEITALDVGQGDSILIGGAHGQAMLVDAGGVVAYENATTTPRFDIGEEVVSPYLWSRGIRHLDVLVLTHAHADHLGGMLAVLNNFHPRELWLSVRIATPPLQALESAARQQGTTIRYLHTGDSIDWGSGSFETLSPSRTYQPGPAPVNNDSLVLLLRYGRSTALLEGDAEHEAEEAIAQTARLRPVTLLKVAHHGSDTSTTEGFLEIIKPQYAIISCGRGNHFGHPRFPVLQRLAAIGTRTARTDTMGAVQYLLHVDGTVETHVLASNPDMQGRPWRCSARLGTAPWL